MNNEEGFSTHFFELAKKYVVSLPPSDQATIAAHLDIMRFGDFASVRTKTLRAEVQELIVGHHRLIYFKIGHGLYFVSGFRKKSAKTPKNEIENAEKIYKMIKR